MAKTVKCAICGKEITKGFFGGTATTLDIADNCNINVCADCHKKYELPAALNFVRFSAKLGNYKYLNRAKPTTDEVIRMFLKYLEEKKQHNAKTSGKESTYKGWFFESNYEGEFGVSERRLGFLASDISRDDKIRSFQSDIITEFGFTKNDISCIEYRLKGGDFNGLFHKIYSLEIRLNKDKDITYKPTIVITAAEGGGFGLGYKHFANKHALEFLEDFKKKINSDLPIVKVRKFR